MVRGLSRRLLVVPIAALVVAHATAAATRDGNADGPPILQRFLSLDDQSPASYRALRHFEARNEKFEPVRFEARDFEARIIQHELDHLDNVLLVHRMSETDRIRLRSQLHELEEKYRQPVA